MQLITYVMIVCCKSDSVDRVGTTLSDGVGFIFENFLYGNGKFDSLTRA